MKRISFGTLTLMILCLTAATIVEAARGTEFVSAHIYGSLWFSALWALAAVTALIWLIKQKVYRKPALFMMHLSFIVILAGAMLTFTTSMRGMLHLRQGETADSFTVQEGPATHPLPFTLSLERFTVDCYPGSQTPADYISDLSLMRDGMVTHERVSMNRVLSAGGFRFYQSSYDSDGLGTILSVNYDPWGIPVTYAGYILFGLTMLALLLAPDGGFRRLLRHPLLKGGLCMTALLAPGSLDASPRTISRTQADELGDMLVMYNGRITPLQTLACDFTLKLTGAGGYEDFTPEQVIAGWIFFPDDWMHEPMILVKDRELRHALGIGTHAPLTAFFNESDGNYCLRLLAATMPAGMEKSPMMKAIAETDEKVRIIRMLQEGTLLTIFPNMEQGKLVWHSPADELPENLDGNETMLIRNLFALLASDLAKGDSEGFSFTIGKFRKYQAKKAGSLLPSQSKIKAEKYYNSLSLTPLLFKINLALGCALFVIFLLALMMPHGRRIARVMPACNLIARILLWFELAVLTAYIGLRAYVSGRLPLSNGYETMLAISWSVLLISALFNTRFRLLLPFGFLLSGFTLLVSTLGQMSPQITPLMPVLHSPWLSIHVSVIMIAYALFAFITLNSLTALLLRALHKGSRVTQVKLMLINRIFLYLAEFFLGAGIFLGAVWANVSWGRYWAWDPKEVWALISFLVYAFPFHLRSLPFFRRPHIFHTYMILAFLTLLMTYFGVNYLLGGLHSYA